MSYLIRLSRTNFNTNRSLCNCLTTEGGTVKAFYIICMNSLQFFQLLTVVNY